MPALQIAAPSMLAISGHLSKSSWDSEGMKTLRCNFWLHLFGLMHSNFYIVGVPPVTCTVEPVI